MSPTDADARRVADAQRRIADFVAEEQDSTFGEAARESVAVTLVMERLVAAVRRELQRASRDISRAIGPIGGTQAVLDELAGLAAYAGKPYVRRTPLPAGIGTPALGVEAPDPRATRPVHFPDRWRKR
jgi:hypothetical protein